MTRNTLESNNRDVIERLVNDYNMSEVEANIILYLSSRRRSTVGKVRKFFMYPVGIIDSSITSLFEKGFITKEKKIYRETISYIQVEITNLALKTLKITKIEKELFIVNNKLRKLKLRKKKLIEMKDEVNEYSS